MEGEVKVWDHLGSYEQQMFKRIAHFTLSSVPRSEITQAGHIWLLKQQYFLKISSEFGGKMLMGSTVINCSHCHILHSSKISAKL